MKTASLIAAGLCLLGTGLSPITPVRAQDGQETAPVANQARLRADVETLVGFGTRHTLSDPDHPTRGIGAARRWAAAEFEKIGADCGGCLVVASQARRFTGPRAPDGAMVVNVLGVQPGTGDPDDIIILSAHIDSRVSDPLDFTSDAPGANDNGSGSALVIEAARLLSKERFAPTIVYALLSGEEQGLWGGTLLAESATAQGWRVRAQLNNDIVGNTIGQDGRVVDDRVRVFSEGIRSSESLAEAMARRGSGAEDDSPSRALMRAANRVAQAHKEIGLDVFGVRRPDRFGRGGDHTPALAEGIPAVRFTVGVEHYDHQHQDVRTEDGRAYGDTIDAMDFAYLAKVTDLNVALTRELARAPMAPKSATLGGAVTTDTIVHWAPVKGAAGYRVYWRTADARDWQQHRDVVGGDTNTLTLPGVIVDDHFYGVAALAEDGSESLVTFAGLPPR